MNSLFPVSPSKEMARKQQRETRYVYVASLLFPIQGNREPMAQREKGYFFPTRTRQEPTRRGRSGPWNWRIVC